MKGRNFLILNDVPTYSTIQPSQVEVHKRTTSDSTLCLIVTDATAIAKYWADYAIYKGRMYQRGMQGVIPDECPKHSVFGYREYTALSTLDRQKDVRSQYIMIFE